MRQVISTVNLAAKKRRLHLEISPPRAKDEFECNCEPALARRMSLRYLNARRQTQAVNEENVGVTADTTVEIRVSTFEDEQAGETSLATDEACAQISLVGCSHKGTTSTDRPPPQQDGQASLATGKADAHRSSTQDTVTIYSDRPQPDTFSQDQAASFGRTSSIGRTSSFGKTLSFGSNSSHQSAPETFARPHPLVAGRNKPRPTAVSVKILIDKWEMSVQDHQEVMLLKVSLRCSWRDPRLCNFPLDRPIPPDIWRPEITCDSSTGLTLSRDSISSLPIFFDKDRDGRVLWEVSTNESSIPLLFNHKDALKVFPFDSHRFDFVFNFGGDGSNRLDSTQDVTVYFNMQQDNVITSFNERKRCLVRPDDLAFLSQPYSGDFTMDCLSYGVGTSISRQTGLQNDCICLSLHVARDPSFVVYNGVVPLVSIFYLALLSFAIDLQLLSDRLNYIMALFLTIIAIKWTITDRLPRVAYLTLIDVLVVVTTCNLLLMATGSVVCHRLIFPWRIGPTSGGKVEAGSIDNAKLSASMTKLGQNLDMVFLGASCLFFLAFSAFCFLSVRSRRSQGNDMHRPWTAGTRTHNKNVTICDEHAWKFRRHTSEDARHPGRSSAFADPSRRANMGKGESVHPDDF